MAADVALRTRLQQQPLLPELAREVADTARAQRRDRHVGSAVGEIDHGKARGDLRVDDGAREALLARKKSLLPSGVREVRGSFLSGDPIEITSLDGKPFARGLAVYGADEVRRIQGLRSAEIESKLGYRLLDCVVHRDDLVVTQ